MDKHLELVECNVDEQEQVDGVFLKLIDKVMTTWETQMDGTLKSVHVYCSELCIQHRPNVDVW